MDRFPSLVIYLSLKALADDPSLWERFHTDDHLILKTEDFRFPYVSAVIRVLNDSADIEVQVLARKLSTLCMGRLDEVPSLHSLLTMSRKDLLIEDRREVDEDSGTKAKVRETVSTEKPRIFISYARADSEFALKLAEELKKAGGNVWVDDLDILIGEPWDREIEEAIKTSKYVLVILSPVSVKSGNVKDELSWARGKKKKILPVLYRKCEIPLLLQRIQYIDLTTKYRSGFRRLLQALNLRS